MQYYFIFQKKNCENTHDGDTVTYIKKNIQER